jgi:hypothetical protein
MQEHKGLQPSFGGKAECSDEFFLLAQKKMAELEPLDLVVMECNTSTGLQYQKEVPRPLQHIIHVLFQITELCSHPNFRFRQLLMGATGV